MFYLHMKAMDFGMKGDSVKAAYNTLEEAQAQAQHNIDTGKQIPLRIVNEQGETLVDYES